MKKLVLIVGICCFIFACANSPKKNYFYLTPNLTTESQSKSEINELIGIGPVEIAEYLSRSQIIDNQTDNSLNLSENAYWAEPLDKSIARVIALNLTQSNSARSFVNFPWRSDSKPRHSIRVRVDNLSRTDNKASINATWELVDNDTKTNIVRRNFIRTIGSDSGARGLAKAYSRLLADLASEMDKELNEVR
ncbi:MAG: membrane integrity-associated transporter subunit PqiC [Gammaproteobacteria bacterium]|nr:MAG: membrane integrity-associated transporter subunit PqiC [Gammaproteobacteria bacterium]